MSVGCERFYGCSYNTDVVCSLASFKGFPKMLEKRHFFLGSLLASHCWRERKSRRRVGRRVVIRFSPEISDAGLLRKGLLLDSAPVQCGRKWCLSAGVPFHRTLLAFGSWPFCRMERSSFAGNNLEWNIQPVQGLFPLAPNPLLMEDAALLFHKQFQQ